MRTTLRKTLGDKIANRCHDVEDLDDEGEVNAVSSPIQSFCIFFTNVHRCSVPRVTLDFGSWAATLLFADRILKSWRFRLLHKSWVWTVMMGYERRF